MEVHAHTHTERKKWTHYLWEFLMLFLAVTLGFFVENQREHMVEHRREVQFIKSYISDLRKDIALLDSVTRKREERKIQIDSLTYILRLPDPDLYGGQLYYYARYLPRPYIYIPNDATIQQLKSSGNLRLIQSQEIKDTMLAYDQQFRFMETIRIREDQLIHRIFNYLNDFFDPAVFDQMNLYDIEFTRPPGKPKLLTKDKKLIMGLLSELQYLRTVNLGEIGWFKKRKAQAESTVAFVEKEYHLK
jgi:hypothetical protein